MRVLLVVHQYLPRHRAGTEVYTHSLAKALGQKHEVLVYCHEPALDGSDTPALQERFEGVAVRRVAAWPQGVRPTPWQLFEYNYHNARIEADYIQMLAEFRPDVVHVQHLKDLSAGLLRITAQRGIPVLMTLNDYWGICPNAQCVRPQGEICLRTHARVECGLCAAGRLKRPALRLAAPLMAPLFLRRQRYIRAQFRHVRRFIAPAEFLRQRYIAAGIPAERIVQMEYGLDLARVSAAMATPRNLPRGHYAFVGSLAWQKGAHVAVEAFRALGTTGAQLRLYGNLNTFPDYVRQLQERASGCAWIRFEGEADDAQLAQALAWADYLIVPSMWWENSPITIQEAYAAGIPVIASRLGALVEKVLDERSGLLFTACDAQALQDVVRRTLGDPMLWQRLRAGRPAVVSMPEHAEHIARLYQGLLQER
jgi:glycosyltransferase involved in cell wall biosynthesis